MCRSMSLEDFLPNLDVENGVIGDKISPHYSHAFLELEIGRRDSLNFTCRNCILTVADTLVAVAIRLCDRLLFNAVWGIARVS
jgi:hypothetical protein